MKEFQVWVEGMNVLTFEYRYFIMEENIGQETDIPTSRVVALAYKSVHHIPDHFPFEWIFSREANILSSIVQGNYTLKQEKQE